MLMRPEGQMAFWMKQGMQGPSPILEFHAKGFWFLCKKTSMLTVGIVVVFNLVQ